MATIEIEAAAEPQHMTALRRANEVRLAGAAVKRDVAARRLMLAAALEDDRAGPVAIMDMDQEKSLWSTSRIPNTGGDW